MEENREYLKLDIPPDSITKQIIY